MFAFAVQREGELLLGRDPVGIKPLYLGRRGAGTVFASEVKAFPQGTRDVRPLAPGTLWSSRTGVARFGVRDRVGLVIVAYEEGVVPPDPKG